LAAQESKDLTLEAIAIRLMGQVAKEQKDLPKSKELLLKALEKFCHLNDPYQLAITYGTWGSLSRDLENFEDSESSMRESLRIASGLKNAEELECIMYQKLTKLMIKLKRLDEADELNAKAEAILFKLRRQVGIAYCNLNKALLAEIRGNFQQALDYANVAEKLFVQYGDQREIATDLQRIQEKAKNRR
jgi:hypothetical protein